MTQRLPENPHQPVEPFDMFERGEVLCRFQPVQGAPSISAIFSEVSVSAPGSSGVAITMDGTSISGKRGIVLRPHIAALAASKLAGVERADRLTM